MIRLQSRPLHQTTLCALVAALLISLTACTSSLEQRFQQHIEYLASDELEGRGVGSEGIELAAQYIAAQYAEAGLQPAGDNGTYFQTLEMTLDRELTDTSYLSLSGDTSGRQVRKDYIPFSFSSEEEFDAEVIFCGYGIVDEDRDRNDFVHVDIDGKVAVIVRGEPESWAGENGFATRNATFRSKIYNAKDRGAVAVLLVNQILAAGESDDLMEFNSANADAYGIPAFHVKRQVIDGLLARAGVDSLTRFQERMDQGSYVSTPLGDARAKGQAVFKTQRAPTDNVLGMLAGSGPHADEIVVVGAHYDHLGIRKPMGRKFVKGKLVKDTRGPQIHNGADDNASGTSGLIEIARMLNEHSGPKRSVLFIAFTAEESGLHGSKYFVDNATVPLENMTAMLNMDMIGRMPPGSNEIEIFGIDCGSDFESIVDRQAKRVGLKTAAARGSGGRSDHAQFVRNKIPSMHFFTGQHRDYHQPSDDSHKINRKDGARVTDFVYGIARELATADTRLTFNEPKVEKQSPGGTPTYRVVMGLAPSYGEDGKRGMPVDAVNPNGPADLAGMKAGDRIVSISGKDVANIYDYMAATRNNKGGDVVPVIVLRGDKEITLQVTLSSAR